jgi:hypothetical protein
MRKHGAHVAKHYGIPFIDQTQDGKVLVLK